MDRNNGKADSVADTARSQEHTEPRAHANMLTKGRCAHAHGVVPGETRLCRGKKIQRTVYLLR